METDNIFPGNTDNIFPYCEDFTNMIKVTVTTTMTKTIIKANIIEIFLLTSKSFIRIILFNFHIITLWGSSYYDPNFTAEKMEVEVKWFDQDHHTTSK